MFLSFVSEHLGDFDIISFFKFCLSIEFIGKQSCPIHILLELEARITNVTSMKSLFKDKLKINKGFTYRCSSFFGSNSPFSFKALSLYNPLKCFDTSVAKITFVIISLIFCWFLHFSMIVIFLVLKILKNVFKCILSNTASLLAIFAN